jgi:hypothetical protein
MLWADHVPPHFHARYGEFEVTVEIETGIVQGVFPRRALRLLLEWFEWNRDGLVTDWVLCSKREMPKAIPPLE